jgi:hypothetical protein
MFQILTSVNIKKKFTVLELSYSIKFHPISKVSSSLSEISPLLRFSSTKYSNKSTRNVNQLNNINGNFYWKSSLNHDIKMFRPAVNSSYSAEFKK